MPAAIRADQPPLDAGLRAGTESRPRRNRHQIFAITSPYSSKEAWRRLKRDHPDLFDRACWLEAHLNQRRRDLGKDPVSLTRHARPLAEVIDDQLTLDSIGADGCDSGWCLT